jgi:hypothetical protein
LRTALLGRQDGTVGTKPADGLVGTPLILFESLHHFLDFRGIRSLGVNMGNDNDIYQKNNRNENY